MNGIWPRFVNAILGIWLMAAPAVLTYDGSARTNGRIVGPLITAAAIIALSEVTRPVHYVNVALGIWLLIAPWLLGFPADATVNSLLVGVVVTACALIRGVYRPQRFGGGWRSLLRHR